jgi:hypothetical protein
MLPLSRIVVQWHAAVKRYLSNECGASFGSSESGTGYRAIVVQSGLGARLGTPGMKCGRMRQDEAILLCHCDGLPRPDKPCLPGKLLPSEDRLGAVVELLRQSHRAGRGFRIEAVHDGCDQQGVTPAHQHNVLSDTEVRQ